MGQVSPTLMVVVRVEYPDHDDAHLKVMFLGNDDFAEMWGSDPDESRAWWDVFEKLHDFDSTFSYEYDYEEGFQPHDLLGEYIWSDAYVSEILEVMTLQQYGYDFTEEIKQWKETNE